MSTTKKVFQITEKQHGKDSDLQLAWQPKHGSYLASSGSNKTLNIFDRNGNVIEKFILAE
jgi:hypothetical protein